MFKLVTLAIFSFAAAEQCLDDSSMIQKHTMQQQRDVSNAASVASRVMSAVKEAGSSEFTCLPVRAGDRAPMAGFFVANGRMVAVSVGDAAPSDGSFCVEDDSSMIQKHTMQRQRDVSNAASVASRVMSAVKEAGSSEFTCLPVRAGERAPMAGFFVANGKKVAVSVGFIAPSDGSFCVETSAVALLQRSFNLHTSEDFEQVLGSKGEPLNGAVGRKTTPCKPKQKLIGFVENWLACPSDYDVSLYDYVMVSFAATTQWGPESEGGNKCDEQCTLTPMAVCSNTKDWNRTARWQAGGTKVLVSLGGAGMGGVWPTPNHCWKYCYDKVDYLVAQTLDIVIEGGLDGVDIDFEDFENETQVQDFLVDLTTKLKDGMGEGKVLTHTPLDSRLYSTEPKHIKEIDSYRTYVDPPVLWEHWEHNAYYKVVERVGHKIDFLMPQYYNGVFQPEGENVSNILAPHYNRLVELMAKVRGESRCDAANRVLYGFCNGDCPGWSDLVGSFNKNGEQALANYKMLEAHAYGNAVGGAFVWALGDDKNASWSGPLWEHFHPGQSLPEP